MSLGLDESVVASRRPSAEVRVFTSYFNKRRTAFLVIDVQRDFCHPKGFLARNGKDIKHIRKMLPRLRYVVKAARKIEARIIFVKSYFDEKYLSKSMYNRKNCQKRKDDACPEGSWGSGLMISPQKNDLVIVKHAFSAFVGTDLEPLLERLNIESLAVAGVLTNVCCESTLRDAFMLGFNTLMLEDCCASDSIEAHRSTIYNVENYFGWVSAAEILLNSWMSDKVNQPSMPGKR